MFNYCLAALDEIVGTVAGVIAPATKSVSRIAGPATLIATALEIKIGFEKYDGMDAVGAAAITVMSTLAVSAFSSFASAAVTAAVGVGAATVTAAVAPVLVGLAVGVGAGILIGIGANKLKSWLYD
ncbi:hypothetical protein SDC9_71953 [bioreactor metagenome]|uniref:Uncharacterized protein n=1 Tax=bioreactor metagenome TaxID=1076179 RepID=A0A644YAX2_9ZZZZ